VRIIDEAAEGALIPLEEREAIQKRIFDAMIQSAR